jgi:hypothetical protein
MNEFEIIEHFIGHIAHPDEIDGCVDRLRTTIETIESECSAQTERAKKAELHLGELLANIHRDGGHYQGKHGTDKAVEDAGAIIVRLRAERDETIREIGTIGRKLGLMEAERDEAVEKHNQSQHFELVLKAALRKANEASGRTFMWDMEYITQARAELEKEGK